MNIRQLLEDRVQSNPDKVFLFFKEIQVSYRDFDRLANKVANSFLKAGIKKGDHFAIMLPNCPEFLYTWFGLNKIGAVEVPINTALKSPEMQYIITHSEAKGVVIHTDFVPLLAEIRPELTELNHVIVVGGEAPGTISWQDWLNDASDKLRRIAISEKDPAVIIYTSGTTGRPKAVLLSHQGWVLTGQSWANMIGAKANDRIMTPNPLFHANAQCYSTMGSLAAGASLVLLEKFSRTRIIEDAWRYQADIMVLVAPTMPMVWSRPPEPADRNHAVRTIMAGGVSPEYFHEFEKRFNVRITTAYSLTEATLAIMAPRAGTIPRKPTPAVGVPMEYPSPSFRNEIRIINDAGEDVPRGKQGQILVRNPAVMLGYFKDPEKTAETMRDGWIYTGDIGYQDADGYFYFVGRSKEVLRRRGELISPAEIEAVIDEHPRVESSAVIGVLSGLGVAEEEIKAYIIIKSGKSIAPMEIVAWCQKRLAEFKVPRYIEFRSSFPRTSLGKIQKSVLKAERKDLTEDCYDRLKGCK